MSTPGTDAAALAGEVEATTIVNKSDIAELKSDVRQLQEDVNAMRRNGDAMHSLVGELIDQRKAQDEENARRWDRTVACMETIAQQVPWGRLATGFAMTSAAVVLILVVAITRIPIAWGDWSIGETVTLIGEADPTNADSDGREN